MASRRKPSRRFALLPTLSLEQSSISLNLKADYYLVFENGGKGESTQMVTTMTPEGSREGKGRGKCVSEETLGNPSVVRPKQERNRASIAIANALEKLNATASSGQISKQEEAVRDLRVRFGDVFSLEELVDAVTVMESEIKARMYLQ
ncbi:hypothetical protein C7212DRAFT_347005 [Tuber magnatum]|uniref:Uncharacterized protein n=1 Tax=Tuber magnatum TaxID=42249 RepID=A0A317SHR0_9PEZI|nr:hypothetical protein C7212DRAFT_347005 [Tuber magnatum]